MARADFAGDEYSKEDIVTRASDDNGHSINLRVHVPTFWYPSLQEVAESPNWPEYRSVRDAVRDAIYHRMVFWNETKERGHLPHVREAIFQEQMRKRLNLAEARKVNWKLFIEEVEEKLSTHIAEGNRAEVYSILEDIGSQLGEIDEPYKSKVEVLISAWTARAGLDWS